MPYTFIYDLTRLSQNLFFQMLEGAYNIGLHKFVGLNAKRIVKLLRIDEATGLNFSEAITLVEDLIEVQVANKVERERFEKLNTKHCLFRIVQELIWIGVVWLILFRKFLHTNAITAIRTAL